MDSELTRLCIRVDSTALDTVRQSGANCRGFADHERWRAYSRSQLAMAHTCHAARVTYTIAICIDVDLHILLSSNEQHQRRPPCEGLGKLPLSTDIIVILPQVASVVILPNHV